MSFPDTQPYFLLQNVGDDASQNYIKTVEIVGNVAHQSNKKIVTTELFRSRKWFMFSIFL
jgi:hypothetical protein